MNIHQMRVTTEQSKQVVAPVQCGKHFGTRLLVTRLYRQLAGFNTATALRDLRMRRPAGANPSIQLLDPSLAGLPLTLVIRQVRRPLTSCSRLSIT